MFDIFFHISCSFFLVLFVKSFTRNMAVALAATLLVGLMKEVFLDLNVSVIDMASNMFGIFFGYDLLLAERRRRRFRTQA